MNKLIIFFILLILSCSTGKPQQESLLSDDHFVFKNLTNTNLIHSFKYQNNQLFSDSTLSTEFIPLDSTFKRLILAPILKKDLGIDAEYTGKFTLSHFISKQEKIGQNQPIVIYSTADDYTSLILALLDSTFKPISHLILSGGLFAGPYEANDSLTSWGEETFSKINDNEITSFVSKTYVWTDSRNDSAFIDSLLFISKIRDNGTIETKLIDSLRIKRKIR
jgi:hypothetical protein